MAEFMVLRNAAAVRTSSPFESFNPSAREAGAPEPQVEVLDVPPHEAADIARDPGVAAVGIPMATTLIMPFDIEAGAAASDVWGIAAVKADTSVFTGMASW